MRLERGVHEVHPDYTRRPVGRGKNAAVSYRLRVSVPEYESRDIELLFSRTASHPRLVAVYSDGPDDSPHRYKPLARDRMRRRALCIWHPDAPIGQRWNPRDGLLSLIALVQVHLFKEAFYRETGEWLGDEVHHHRGEGEAR
jgi:hypothetical protein